jgi:hypothetical protein
MQNKEESLFANTKNPTEQVGFFICDKFYKIQKFKIQDSEKQCEGGPPPDIPPCLRPKMKQTVEKPK